MLDLDRIEAFYAPKLATADDDPTDCPRCHVTVAVRDGEEWAPDEGDYCDHCEGAIGRAAREDVPALVAELRTAADERADVVAWLARQVDSLDAKPLGSDDVTYGARLMCEDAIDAFTQGAHVGAAKGANHG